MSSSFQSGVSGLVPSDEPDFSSAQLAGGSNFQTGLTSFQTETFGNTHLSHEDVERQFSVSFTPNVVDFAAELDNAIFHSRNPEYDSVDTSSELYLALMTSIESAPLPSLFPNPEFESFGASLYTQYTLEHPWEPARLSYFNLLSSTPPPIEPPTSTSTLPISPVVTGLPSTPSLSYSDHSTYSSPSPVSPIDHDVIEVINADEDPGRHWRAPSSSSRSNKRVASGRSATAKKKRESPAVAPVSVARPRAMRFPCTVPGCKQVCKTLGDLKRHESVLSHKRPSWECRRCRYQFTREDALKRHTKNLPNCTSGKTPKGRAASMKLQRPEVTPGVDEAV